MLAMQCWNRNQVYSSIASTLATLRWCKRHIVNQKETHYYHVTMIGKKIAFYHKQC